MLPNAFHILFQIILPIKNAIKPKSIANLVVFDAFFGSLNVKTTEIIKKASAIETTIKYFQSKILNEHAGVGAVFIIAVISAVVSKKRRMIE